MGPRGITFAPAGTRTAGAGTGTCLSETGTCPPEQSNIAPGTVFGHSGSLCRAAEQVSGCAGTQTHVAERSYVGPGTLIGAPETLISPSARLVIALGRNCSPSGYWWSSPGLHPVALCSWSSVAADPGSAAVWAECLAACAGGVVATAGVRWVRPAVCRRRPVV